MRGAILVALAAGLVGCTHSPDTMVHFAAPGEGGWEVREPAGARLCTLPCSVGLDAHQSVVVTRGDMTQFVVQQDSVGPGVWSGVVRVRYTPKPGALAVQAFSGALVSAGATLLDAHREDRVGEGVLLSALGTAGLLVSGAWPGTPHEELWLARTGAP